MKDPKSLDDVPLTSYSQYSISVNRTGAWKYAEPQFEEKLPPCAHLCPAGNDISKSLLHLARGELAEAAQLWRAGNPLPATLGRVCPHPCETQCNREDLGGAVAVHMIERFLGDYSLDAKYLPPKEAATGKRVAVIGAGPAGITAAYHLALAGHSVEVFDDKPEPGGYLRTGIPDYRLPKDILDKEIDLVRGLGVTFRQNARVGVELTLEAIREEFDAVVVSVGLHQNRPLGIPGEEHPDVYNGVQLLERILLGCPPEMPERVAVVGGGNTAMDVARSLLRLGRKPVVVYRRTRAEMPAIASEVDEALAEGIPFHFLTAPKTVVVKEGRVEALECLRMELGEPDASGRRRPEPVAGSEFLIPCESVVTAIGEGADLGLLPPEAQDESSLTTNPCLRTPVDKVFAAGDVVDAAGTVTAAVCGGRRAAAIVDHYLRKEEPPDAAPRPVELWEREVNLTEVVQFEHLNPVYFITVQRPQIRHLEPSLRINSFAEVVEGWTLEEAIAEAQRCLACGTCNECGNCYYFCPDMAVHKRADGFGYEIDAEHCKGCGICVEECPRGALSLREAIK